jgi:hypothetical protein
MSERENQHDTHLLPWSTAADGVERNLSGSADGLTRGANADVVVGGVDAVREEDHRDLSLRIAAQHRASAFPTIQTHNVMENVGIRVRERYLNETCLISLA